LFDVHTVCRIRGDLAPWFDVGVDCRKEASIAKAAVTEAYFRVSDVGIQILGGYWLTLDFQVKQRCHNARLMRSGGAPTT